MRCRSVTGFSRCWQLGYSCTSARDGTHALHGPQCLQGIIMYSALCALQRGHGGSVRAGAWPGTGVDAGACQTWLMGLAGDPTGAIGGRNGRGGGLGAAAAGGGQHAPARPAVPAVSGTVKEQSDPTASVPAVFRTVKEQSDPTASVPAADWGNRHAHSQLSMQDHLLLYQCRLWIAQVKLEDCMGQERVREVSALQMVQAAWGPCCVGH